MLNYLSGGTRGNIGHWVWGGTVGVIFVYLFVGFF